MCVRGNYLKMKYERVCVSHGLPQRYKAHPSLPVHREPTGHHRTGGAPKDQEQPPRSTRMSPFCQETQILLLICNLLCFSPRCGKNITRGGNTRSLGARGAGVDVWTDARTRAGWGGLVLPGSMSEVMLGLWPAPK